MTESISRKFSRLGLGVSETGTLTVNSATASKWATARTLTLSGDLSGNVSIDGSDNVTLTATVSGNTVALGTDTTGDYVASVTAGTGISVSGTGESAAVTVAIDSTVATLTGSQILTNKTIALGNNTVSGTLAQFNTAVTDADFASLAGSETLTNKTLTSPVISSISNTGTLTLPTSTDTLVGRATTDTLTNKTISGADNTLSNIGNASLTNSSITINGTSVSLGGTRTLVTDDVAEDASPVNLWYTDARARSAISITDAGGDGSLSYVSGTGVITYTGPSATEVRAHFSAGTGVTITSGQVAIGQAVATTDNVTFAGVTVDNIRVGVTAVNEIDTSTGNLVLDSTGGTTTIDDNATITGNLQIDGNLTVSGTTVTMNTTTLSVEDNMIYLNSGSAVANPDLGFAGNYNDGTYRHAGVFRDATDGVFKFFHQYTPEPDAAAYIDTTHGSFALAPIQASTFTGNVTGDVTGNASTATTWQTARTLTLTGDVTGTSASFNGSGNISISTTIAADSVALGTDTTGNYVASITNGNYITGGNGGSEGAALTLAVDATSANTASKVVARDASGNFSAGTITAALSGNATTATTAGALTSMNISQFTNNSGYITGLSFDGLSSKTGGTGTYTTSGDFRAPIFYDSNDTAYYVDPNTTATSIYVRGEIRNPSIWINDGDNYNDYNENIRLFNAPNGVSVIAFSASGTGGMPTTSILGYGSYMERRFNHGWQDRMYNGYVEAAGSYRAPIFYDSNNTGYYVNPDSTSYLYHLELSGGAYFQPNSWIQFNSSYGIYWPNHYGAHLYPNTGSTYTQLRIDGSKGGYSGMWMAHSSVNGMMYDSSGNGGVYREANGLWYFYYLVSNGCMGIGTSTTSSSYGVYVVKGGYFDGRVDGTIFYDANNTGYYCDPNGTARLSYVVANAGIRIDGNENLYLDNNYGQSIIGVYASTRYQGIFAMGNAYKLPIDGSSTGSLYGLAWSHPNAGGVAGNLNTHGLLAMENGGWLASLTGSTRSRDDMRAPRFYDNNDTGYYADFNENASVYGIRMRSGILMGPNYTWGAYLLVGGDGKHAQYQNSGDVASVVSTNGNLHLDAGSGKIMYLNYYDGDSIYFCNGGNSVWGEWSGGVLYSYSQIRGTSFYDYNNTSYYCDPNSSSQMSSVYANDWFRAQNDTGFYFQTYGYGSWSAHSGGNSYGNVTTYGGGRNGWTGWGIGSRHVFMSTTGDNVGVHDNSRGWIWYWDGSYTRFDYGYTQFAGSGRAPIFYDSNDTNWYCDPNSTSRFWTLSLENRLYIYGGNPGDPGSDVTPQVFFKTGGGMGLSSIEMDYWTGFTGSSYPNNFQIGFRMAYDKRLYVWQDVVQNYSDERLKEKTGTLAGALDAIKAWTPFKYVDNALANSFNYGSSRTQIGLSAQEVQQYYPELVDLAPFDAQSDFSDETNPRTISKSGENYLTLNYTRLVPVLIQAIKEQQAKIEELERRINNS